MSPVTTASPRQCPLIAKHAATSGRGRSLGFDLEVIPGDEFEDDEAEAGAEGEGGVEEPEVGGGPFLEEAADPADHRVRGEEGEIIKADDGGVDCFRRVLGE